LISAIAILISRYAYLTPVVTSVTPKAIINTRAHTKSRTQTSFLVVLANIILAQWRINLTFEL
jgi:hypothetical protein